MVPWQARAVVQGAWPSPGNPSPLTFIKEAKSNYVAMPKDQKERKNITYPAVPPPELNPRWDGWGSENCRSETGCYLQKLLLTCLLIHHKDMSMQRLFPPPPEFAQFLMALPPLLNNGTLAGSSCCTRGLAVTRESLTFDLHQRRQNQIMLPCPRTKKREKTSPIHGFHPGFCRQQLSKLSHILFLVTRDLQMTQSGCSILQINSCC